MTETVLIATACTLLAGLPLLVSGRRALLNPALYVFLAVLWSVFLKSLYLALFHSKPYPRGHDLVYVDATSADYFTLGAWLIFAGICSYVVGFFLLGRRMPGADWLRDRRLALPAGGGGRAIALLSLLALGCFVVYLLLSHASLFDAPLSAKRFKPEDIGVASRFEYPPYYFFKLALLSGSIAYVAVLFLLHAESRRELLSRKWIFSWVFLLALFVAHYSSLRLFILLVLLQISLLLFHQGKARLWAFMSFFAALTVASFVSITYYYRAQLKPPAAAPQTETTSVATGAAPVEPVEVIANESPPESRPEVSEETTRQPPPAPPTPKKPRRVKPKPRAATSRALAERLRDLARSSFAGRYFMDITRMAHIAHHFPHSRPYLLGYGVVGLNGPVSAEARATTVGGVSLSKYLAVAVFKEPRNNIPASFAGELYLSFGWWGLVPAFLALGAFHRGLLNLLTYGRLPLMIASCFIVLLPTTTLVLLGSGLIPALSRSVLDIGVILAFWKLAGLVGLSGRPKTAPARPA